VREREGAVRIERVRRIEAPGGEVASEDDLVELASVSAAQLAAEAAVHGLREEPPRRIDATADHVGSTVVLLRG
jgi:hypothetical protein